MSKRKELFFAFRQFIIFSLLVAFIVSVNIVLFLNDATIIEDEIRSAAPATFVNVFVIAGIFTAIDQLRRYMQIAKPVKKIQAGLNRVMEGDFTTVIETSSDNTYAYNNIIDSINKMIKELAGVETLRTDFIANVSHELKTPLAVIQNYSTLLGSKDITEEERMEYSRKITEQTTRLSSLITNILKLNKLENQQIFPEMKAMNLSESVCECMLGFEQIWNDKDIDISTEIEDDIEIVADKEMLSLVWNNLFSNAMKFTEPGGKVSLTIKKEDNKAVVCISDTGCGMDEETGKNIFKKFYQGDTSHSMAGNGLGLALVKRVVDIHGGDIAVSSKLGMGTSFTVKLWVNGR